jgi:transposase
MRVIPLTKRWAILADCDAGRGTKAVAARHSVSGTFVRALKKERRTTGSVRAPRQRGPGRAPKIPRVRLQEIVAADADATLVELRARLGIACSLSALWTVLHDLKITFKKNAPRRGARPPRRRRTPRHVAGLADRTRSAAARFHRRNVGHDEHDAAARAGPAWAARD